MNEDKFNTSLRGFLKKVGITSQREIEKAVRDAVAAGRLKGNARKAKATSGKVHSAMISWSRPSQFRVRGSG